MKLSKKIKIYSLENLTWNQSWTKENTWRSPPMMTPLMKERSGWWRPKIIPWFGENLRHLYY